MYGSSGTPPIAGGITSGALAYTGTEPAIPIIIFALTLLTSGLLLLRTTYLRHHTNNH